MDLRMKPEVEPLDARRWDRIEGELFAKLETESAPPREAAPGRVRPMAILVAGSAIAAAVALGLFARPSAPVGASGPSRFVTQGGASHVDLTGAALDLGPESAVVVSGDDEHGMVLVLDRGSVGCEVSPRHGRPPFIVQAGEVSVKVVGTHFTVRRAGDSASVEVDKGVVEVTARGQVAVVRLGERWPAVATPASGPAPIEAERAPDGPAPASVPAPIAPAATTAKVVPSGAKTPTPQELYAAATELEARRPEQAVAIYRELARGDGPWAANALFAEGRLAVDRGRRAEARQLLTEYLRRFPRGANAEDARQLLQGLL